MKVLICDYTGISAQWLDNLTIRTNYEIVGTLLPENDKSLLSEKSWDYLLIFEQGARPFFVTLTQFMNIPAEKVIYALDGNSWTEHPAAVHALINMNRGGRNSPFAYLCGRSSTELFHDVYDGRRIAFYYNI